MDSNLPKILVVGAGISGTCASLELAETGYRVILTEKAPAVGGILNQLDHQFPNDHCGICRMLPMVERDGGSQFCVRRGFFHDNITVMTSTRVLSVEGNTGNFTIKLSKDAEGVDPEKCTNCGKCLPACPEDLPDGFNGGLSRRKAVYFPTPTRIPAVPVIDWENCTQCGSCADICPEDAISLEKNTREVVLENIDGVIVATGTPLVDPALFDVYGYGVLPNVVTATAFERLLSSSGPWEGKPMRPSDGKPIKKVAWIQCVGSRNIMIGADNCSSACCMFAVKEAMLAKEKIGPDTDAAIFYMDMRTYGRDFQRYRDAAEKVHGVRFVRCRVHSVEPSEKPGDLKLSYVDETGNLLDETFDVVVLSTGQKPGAAIEDVFAIDATGDGVLVLDSASGLKDISQAVMGASRAAVVLGQTVRGNGLSEKYEAMSLENRDAVFNYRHRICVVLCRNEKSSEAKTSWIQMAETLKALPGKLDIIEVPTTCSDKNWQTITDIVKETRSNRLILVSEKPYQLWPDINTLYRSTGLLASQVEVVDLHLTDGTKSEIKAIEMAVNRVRTRKAATGLTIPVTRTALVLGGGPAGLAATLALSGNGVHVVLVEKCGKLGGNLCRIVDPDTRKMIGSLVEKVQNNVNVDIHLGTSLIEHSGTAGKFQAILKFSSGEEASLNYGAMILATGGGPGDAGSYASLRHENIMTQFDLEKRLVEKQLGSSPPKTVVMIQCAGSREEPRNYCSRICCLKALKNAMAVKENFSGSDVYVLYRDIMTYGDSEKLYTAARRAGVLFIPFGIDRKPDVRVEEGRLVVEGFDPVMGEDVRIEPDILALSTGLIPSDTEGLLPVLDIEITGDGFIGEADSKWRPVDSGKEGIFVCGLARNPVRAEEAISEGQAAAQRALRILSKKVIIPQRTSARVRHVFCARCEMCISACMYGARFFDVEKNQVMVDPAACQGCGTCAAVCPNSATVMGDFEDDGVMGAIEAALE